MSKSRNSSVETVRKENSHGIMKTYVRVTIGTTILEVPNTVTNPTTGKTQKLTNLSPDGYCLKFLAAWNYFNSQTTVNLSDSPVITLDKDRWDINESDDTVIAQNKKAESKLGEMVLE